jgi:hypothetical protein
MIEEIPEEVQFKCPQCKAPCILYPKRKPYAVVHALPTCKLWQKVPKQRTTAQFLIDAGVHLHVPGSTVSN